MPDGGSADGRCAGTVSLSQLNAALDLADRGQVFVELALVRGAEVRFQVPGFLDGPVEDALAVTGLPRGRRRIQLRIDGAEQPLEDVLRVGNGRQGRRRRAPADATGVGAAVVPVAQAHDAVVLETQFERGQPRLPADRLGGHLIGRHAGVDVGTRFAGVRPGQEAGGGAGVVPAAGAQGVGVVVHQVGEDERVVAERLQGLEDGGELEVLPLRGGRPARHDHAVGDVDETQARGRLRFRVPGPPEGRHHRVEKRKPDEGTRAPQEGSARQMFSSDNHRASLGFHFRIWNGSLWTIPSTRLENR